MKQRIVPLVLTLAVAACTSQPGPGATTLTLLDGERFKVDASGPLVYAPGPNGKREKPSFDVQYESHVDVHDHAAVANEAHKLFRIIQLYAEAGGYASVILGALGPSGGGLLSHRDGFNTLFVKKDGVWQLESSTPPPLVKPLADYSWLLGTWKCKHHLSNGREVPGIMVAETGPGGTTIEESQVYTAYGRTGIAESELSYDAAAKTWSWLFHPNGKLEADRSTQTYSRTMRFTGSGKDTNMRMTQTLDPSETSWSVLIESHSAGDWKKSETIDCAKVPA